MSYARQFLQAAALMLGILVLVLLSAAITMKVITWGRTVDVPELTGKDVTTAIGELRKSGLDIKVERQEHHPTVPEGHIISQLPQAGTSVKKGRDVQVVVSLGSQEVTVPDITGEVFRKVQVELKQAGLILGEVARARTPLPREQVVVQYPAARSVLQKGATIDLLVSDGPLPQRYVTPDLAGMNVSDAGQAVKGLSVSLATSGAGKQVVSQDPRPGFPVLAGSQVSVTLGTKAQGPPVQKTSPAPAPVPSPAPAPANTVKERA